MSAEPTATSGRPFLKMHGLRNHFVIVDARTDPYRPDVETIVRICDPEVGIGADQLVVLEATETSGADVFMRLYNVDGREVGACGNATRCVAWLLLEEQSADSVGVETHAGVLECQRAGDHRVTCDMGRIRTGWQEVPLAEARRTDGIDLGGLRGGFALNVGNPHIVFVVDDVDGVDLVSAAERIQAAPLFPESVNVSVAQRVYGDHLRLRVFERGAGLTMACGSGACAAAFAARESGVVDAQNVTVSLPGGDVQISLDQRDDGNVHAIMTGPVAHSFRGEIDPP
ncbi:MAG: diaminopimelate epimerase [Pseudomonadota bacterium]